MAERSTQASCVTADHRADDDCCVVEDSDYDASALVIDDTDQCPVVDDAENPAAAEQSSASPPAPASAAANSADVDAAEKSRFVVVVKCHLSPGRITACTAQYITLLHSALIPNMQP